MHQLGYVAMVGVLTLLLWALRGKQPTPTSIEPWVIAAFRKRRQQQVLISIPAAIFFVWVFKYSSGSGALHGLLWLVGVAWVAWICLYTYRTWRCPKCGAYLGQHPLVYGRMSELRDSPARAA